MRDMPPDNQDSSPPIVSLFKSYWLWRLGAAGVLRRGKLRSGPMKTGAIFFGLFLGLNAYIASNYSSLCPREDLAASLAAGPIVAGLTAFAAALLALRLVMRRLYQEPIFDRYGFGAKFGASFAEAATWAFFAAGVTIAHNHLFASLCAQKTGGLAAPAIAVAAGFCLAAAVYVLRQSIKAVPIQHSKMTRDFLAMFDLGMRRSLGRNAGRASGLVRPAAKTTALRPLLSAMSSLRAQARAALSQRLRMISLVFVLLISAIVAAAMTVQGNKFGFLVTLAITTVLLAEIVDMPELIFDERIAFSGRRFYRVLMIFIWPFVAVVVAFGVMISFFWDQPGGVIATTIAVVAAIPIRFVMRICTYMNPMSALRLYLSLATGAVIGFQFFGPFGLLWLVVAPAFFYARAKRLVQRT
ncbi:MAG TPA: hypothetical protein VNH64_09345 [Parvularculaceae bacterium]|nr:hypothetical protein [Parvularculaceae bacterium]